MGINGSETTKKMTFVLIMVVRSIKPVSFAPTLFTTIGDTDLSKAVPITPIWPLIWVAIACAALTIVPKNMFTMMLIPCEEISLEALPNKFHPANATISLNTPLSQN